MVRIHWLASYPKSGNTWLRILLTNYLRNGEHPADISERLEGGPIASARIWFDEWAGIEASALADRTIERLRPGVYRCLATEENRPLYMKVHDAWKRTDQGEPMFPAEVTGGVVYILRNPLDLAASLANHYGIDCRQAVENLGDPSYAAARSVGGLADQLRQEFGSWSSHVRSWLDHSGLPCLAVRFEDLLADAETEFGRVLRFLGLAWEDSRLSRAVAHSSFAALRRQEEEHGFPERPLNSAAFFRHGIAGGWRKELTPDLVARVIEDHRDVMRRFGYLDGRGEPV